MRVRRKVNGSSHMSGRKPVFDAKTETDLVDIIKDLSQRGFPLGTKKVRSTAYNYTLQHGIDGFSARKKAAAYEWLKSFLKRHPEQSIRQPDRTCIWNESNSN